MFLIDYGLACLAGDAQAATAAAAEHRDSSSAATVWVEVSDAPSDRLPAVAGDPASAAPVSDEASAWVGEMSGRLTLQVRQSTSLPRESSEATQSSVQAVRAEKMGGKIDGSSNGSESIEGAALLKPVTKSVGGATGLVGSVRYLSLAAHTGGRQTRRCDLESLAYVLVYLVRVSKVNIINCNGSTQL